MENSSAHWKNQTYYYYDKLNLVNTKYFDKIIEYDNLAEDYREIDRAYDEQIDQYYELLTKPRVEIEKTVMKWSFKDSKGNLYGINWPIKSYEDIKSYSDWKSLNQDIVRLNNNGETIKSISLDGFVTGNTFDCCIDKLYENSSSNKDFIYEVWGIVSQMTIYDKDVDLQSEGRFALETIHRGGGDCEDLTILIAELLKSSSYTKDWEIQYIMDSENPKDPQTVNHVILSVNDGTNNYLIEVTGNPNESYFPDGVRGWFFDV